MRWVVLWLNFEVVQYETFDRLEDARVKYHDLKTAYTTVIMAQIWNWHEG